MRSIIHENRKILLYIYRIKCLNACFILMPRSFCAGCPNCTLDSSPATRHKDVKLFNHEVHHFTGNIDFLDNGFASYIGKHFRIRFSGLQDSVFIGICRHCDFSA